MSLITLIYQKDGRNTGRPGERPGERHSERNPNYLFNPGIPERLFSWFIGIIDFFFIYIRLLKPDLYLDGSQLYISSENNKCLLTFRKHFGKVVVHFFGRLADFMKV